MLQKRASMWTIAVVVGGSPRKEGMERKNVSIYKAQASAIE